LLFAAPAMWWIFRLKAEAAGRSVASGSSRKIVFRRKILVPALAFAAVTGALFAINTAISGEWNYQGGDRKSYYAEFPFQTDGTKNSLGVEKSRETAMTQVVLNPRTFTSNLTHNLEYFFIGRYAGMLGYFFPAFFAIGAFLAAPRKRPGWQWLVLAAALASGLVFVVATPYTWSGGGVGNRYWASGYGVMLFVLPPIESMAAAFVPWAIGGLFVAPMVLNPFVASFRPNENAKTGPLRLLPVELTLLNDLPVWSEGVRARTWLGDLGRGDPGFLVSFLDGNAYDVEADKSFWTRGDSRAEMVFKANKPIRRATFLVTAGAVPVDFTVRLGGRRHDLHLAANDTQQIVTSMPEGLLYEKEVEGVHLWVVTMTTKGGFTPIFHDSSSTDARYLGARIQPMLETRPQ
jgi:hypothetical protein